MDPELEACFLLFQQTISDVEVLKLFFFFCCGAAEVPCWSLPSWIFRTRVRASILLSYSSLYSASVVQNNA